LKNRLIAASAEMGVPLSEAQAEKLMRYHEMLVSANREMNLTRVPDDPIEAADRNYLDSLAVVRHLSGVQTLIDVGTGAGFPGLPVAIACPHIQVTLMDALNKRVGFLKSVAEELALTNVTCIHARAEEGAKKEGLRDSFDCATARAVAEMNLLSEWLLPFVKPGGRMLALKGPSAEEELSRAENALAQLNAHFAFVYSAPVPGRDWDHKLVEIVKDGETPARFPRRPGVAEKKPL